MQDSETLAIVKGVGGAIIGGSLGYLLFRWMLNNWNVYAIVLIGAGIGLGFAYLYGKPSLLFGILCGMVALMASIVGDWSVTVTNDNVFQHAFNLVQQRMIFPLMIGLSGFFGFWFGQGRPGARWNRNQ